MRLAWFVAVVMALASCATSEVTQIGARRPARDPSCSVDVVRVMPNFPVVDLASARAHCPFSGPPYTACLEELRTRACEVGADVIYNLTETLTVSGNGGEMQATLATRSGSAPAPAASAAACTPICSPGFDCQAGQCIPVCNPACDADEICNRHRSCQPKTP